jgi:hypothetical protein
MNGLNHLKHFGNFHYMNGLILKVRIKLNFIVSLLKTLVLGDNYRKLSLRSFLANASCRTLSDSSCLPTDKPHSADLIFDFLMHNFERHSSLSVGYRSPFIIELDLSWLSQDKNQRLDAVTRFIEYILTSQNHRYVYFVSIEKALEWLKYPRSLNDLRDFWAFSCSDATNEYDLDCFNTMSNENEQEEILNTKNAKLNNKTNTSDSELIDRQSEKLFRSGIVLHALWISILLILSVLFYDKYFTKK